MVIMRIPFQFLKKFIEVYFIYKIHPFQVIQGLLKLYQVSVNKRHFSFYLILSESYELILQYVK